jgi:SAM-dependent methyltransferase
MHRNGQLLFEKYALPLFEPSARVLEIGPDLFPSTYRVLVGDRAQVWDTLGIDDDDRLTYPNCSVDRYPVESGSYDIVLSGNVIEHVARIWDWMPEVARLARPGGVVITVSPTSWPFHQYPIDCWRIYPDGMTALLERAGLAVELCVNEALELPGTKPLPGRSPEHQPRRVRRAFRVMGLLGLPVEQARDTISIARKPLAAV